MKKIISMLSILFFAITAVSAADKANVKFGPIKYKTKQGAAAVAVGNQTQITLGGNKGTTAGTFTIFLEASEIAQLEKGARFDVVTTNQDSTNDDAVTILFQGTKTKIKGFNTTVTGITADDSSEVTKGTFKVVQYDPNTGVLKFLLKAKVQGYTLSKSGVNTSQTNQSVDKPLKISIQGVITLPQS